MQDEMNAAAAIPDEHEENIDKLPPQDDEFRQKIILQLPSAITEENEDGQEQEKVQWTWHVIEVPESLIETYNQTNDAFNDAMEAVCDEEKTVKIQAVKDNQKLVVKKRGEAKKPGLYLQNDDEQEEATLIAYVLESGKGKLSEEQEKELDARYFQDNNEEVANDNDEQDNGLDGGDGINGIAPT